MCENLQLQMTRYLVEEFAVLPHNLSVPTLIEFNHQVFLGALAPET